MGTKLTLEKQQRIDHLNLQGFTMEQISEMQKVSIYEVEKVIFGYELYQDSSDIGDAPFIRINTDEQAKKL